MTAATTRSMRDMTDWGPVMRIFSGETVCVPTAYPRAGLLSPLFMFIRYSLVTLASRLTA